MSGHRTGHRSYRVSDTSRSLVYSLTSDEGPGRDGEQLLSDRCKFVFYNGTLTPPLKLVQIVHYPSRQTGMEYHSHPCYQIILSVSGTMTFKNTVTSAEVGTGAVIIIPPNKPHTWATQRICVTVQILFDPLTPSRYGSLARVFGVRSHDWMTGKVHIPFAKHIEHAVRQECGPPRAMGELLLHAYFLELLTHVYRILPRAISSDTVDDIAIENTLRYIEDHFREHISLDDMAAQANLRQSRFSALFQEHTGKSPLAYCNDHRMEKAKSLLLYSGMSVTEIAEYLGYTTIHYFSRAFKKQAGVSPVQFCRANNVKK